MVEYPSVGTLIPKRFVFSRDITKEDLEEISL